MWYFAWGLGATAAMLAAVVFALAMEGRDDNALSSTKSD